MTILILNIFINIQVITFIYNKNRLNFSIDKQNRKVNTDTKNLGIGFSIGKAIKECPEAM